MGVVYGDLLIGPQSESLCQKLVQSGLAVSTGYRPHLLPQDGLRPPIKLIGGDTLKVCITAAQSPWDFYFQDVSYTVTTLAWSHPFSLFASLESGRGMTGSVTGSVGVTGTVGSDWKCFFMHFLKKYIYIPFSSLFIVLLFFN